MKLSLLASLAPGTGNPSSPRNPLEGGTGPDFGALLGGMEKDAPAGSMPAVVAGGAPSAEASGSTSASAAIVLAPGNGEEEGAGSQPKVASPPEDQPEPPGVAKARAPSIVDAFEAPGTTNLLTLATRAAAQAVSAATGAPPASEVAASRTVVGDAKVAGSAVPAAGGAPTSGHGMRRPTALADDDAGGPVADTTAPAPMAVAALLVATGAIVPAKIPDAVDVTRPPSRSDAPRPANASAPEVDITPKSVPESIAPSSAEGVSLSSSPPPVVAGPTTVAGKVENAPVAPSAATTVDTAIVSHSVRVESHLGFDRGARIGVAAASGRDTTGRAEGVAVDSVSLDADVDVADTATARPAVIGEIAASNGAARSAMPSAMQAPLASHPTRVPNVPAAAGGERLVPPPSTLAPEARKLSAGVASSPSITEASSSSSKPAEGPNAPAFDTEAPVPAAPVAGIAVPTPQAAPSVTQQVADGVAGLAATVVPEETGVATPVAPARTMALQLSPAGLGTLSVRLHVSGRALDVHLEASDGRTAALIDRDRDALSGALRGKDYQLQTLSVTTHDATMPGGTHADRGTDPRSADPRFADNASADPGSPGHSRNGSSGGRSGEGGSRDASGREPRASGRPVDDAVVERGGASLFV